MDNQKNISSLEILNEKINKLKQCIENKQDEIDKMETDPLIITYNSLLNDLGQLTEECDGLEKIKRIEFQKQCKHPLVYITKNLDDVFEYGFRSKCICCDFEREIVDVAIDFWDSFKEFEKKHKIISREEFLGPIDTPFETIQNEFHDLENQGFSEDEISEMIYEKYSNRKQRKKEK